MIRTVTRPVCLVLVAVLVAACGGTASTPTAAGASGAGATAGAPGEPAAIPAACTLLTDGDITEITGLTVVSKADNVLDTVYANHCRLTIQRSDGGNGTLDVGILSPGGRDRYDHSGGGSGLDPIEGLPADVAGEDTNVGGIYAVRGDTLVDVYSANLAFSTETEIELMRRALERLGGSTAAAGTPRPAGTGIASDPCALLTDGEIKEVTGFAAVSHSSSPRVGMFDTSCLWEVESASVVPASIMVAIKSPGGRASWDQYVVPIVGEFTAIDGLGDAAFGKVHWPTHVLVGDTYVSVQFTDFAAPEEPISTDLARRVVEKLAT